MSIQNLKYYQSLVDKSYIGWVTVENVTVINTFPTRYLNIEGIVNNVITSVLIDTIVYFYHSNIGWVIVIMHQYA